MIESRDISQYPEYILQMAVAGDFTHVSEESSALLVALTPEERAQFLRTRYEDHSKACEGELRRILTLVNPLNLLAFLTSVSQRRIEGGETPAANPLSQAHVELAQFLVLGLNSIDTIARPSLQTYSKISHLLRAYQSSAALGRSPALDMELSEQQTQERRLAYVTAQNFSVVRNWAYPRQLEELILSLTSPLADEVFVALGLRPASVISMWGRVWDLVFERLRFIYELRSVISGGRLESARERLTACGLKLNMEHLVANVLRASDESPMDVLNNLLEEVFTFDLGLLKRIAAQDDLQPSALKDYLKHHALRPGDLENHNLDRALYENPVWRRPLIDLGADRFFVCLPSLFYAFVFPHIESIFELAGIERKYEERRAQFLESRLQTLVAGALPSASIFPGSLYIDAQEEFENDLLVKCGNWLLIFEAKSQKVTNAAKRGGYKSLIERINRMIVDPSEQSSRFARYLLDNIGRNEFRRKKGSPNRIDTSHVGRIIRVSVILESFGGLTTQIRTLSEMGIADDHQVLAVTINILDLAVAFEVLRSEDERLDYLFRRTQLSS